ncbi:SpvB/TcaC N-terminal domain-containing protein [Yinghuangia seranimata]|uniref:SpvB/TcaC N-terminal domain-containing protein n=1 Tax=Yinghuangia seranimata TaxID=408067 RepID=UPI00248C0C72|nr:SpvB/TcaC N-terminal domain-containing protein [Yinghuangia seranimata]MDI2127062.1 SpvB/TcaC N-terminal domain-containing protein [Yinghuangia seranimata]
MDAGTDPTVAGSVVSLPSGGGAVSGLGEKFTADPFTGTGAFALPLTVPAGRRGVQPQLALSYGTGQGNGPFGLGWRLDLPGVARRTSRGVPRYVDAGDDRPDVFVLSGAEDLVPVVGAAAGRTRYRPRTEGLFARIEHVQGAAGDFWEVRAKDGSATRYGTPRPDPAPDGWTDPAAVADPGDPHRVFGWRITETRDPLGNLVRYEYLRDQGRSGPHAWDQPLVSRISYADYGDRARPDFLVSLEFLYEPRPDPFSDYRAGFEIRTTLRCKAVRIATHASDGVTRTAREYRFGYGQAPFNAVSLLTRVDDVGVDDQGPTRAEEAMPPLTFAYTPFDPAGRAFAPVTTTNMPPGTLGSPGTALVDLRGGGLPDAVELGPVPRVWRNAGGGRFEAPRPLADAPPFPLGDAGVSFLDADGDGRPDLLVSAPRGPGRTGGAPLAGYFPVSFAGGWSRRGFRRYAQAPSVDLADPAVRLIDLDGDGLTDVVRSGPRPQCWFNDRDPRLAWRRTARGTGLDVDLADPSVRIADMTGDGLSDLVVLRRGSVVYHPSLGHGRWGAAVVMSTPPRLPDGHDPRRILLGDVDGDGVADLVYVDRDRVLVWANRGGGSWAPEPVVVRGTPAVTDADAVRLADLYGTGMSGVLFTRTAARSGRGGDWFLDLAGAAKPYLLTAMDNHRGARTTVRYRPSTHDFLRDQASAATRWRTPLPFPVHVVAGTEVADAVSNSRLTTEFRYHHGYWDGVEREFRGFAMVEQLDSEAFDLGGPGAVPAEHFSPPTLTKTWFHPGPVAAAEADDWTELDLSAEYWDGDRVSLPRPAATTALLTGLPPTARRAALRTLRGRVLRTELYALDGTAREARPYTVTETVSGVREVEPRTERPDAERVFFPFTVTTRTTQWERGSEPMTRFVFTDGHDAYGFATRLLDVAVPRGRDPLAPADPATGRAQPYLATFTTTEFARRDDADHYLVDRVARVATSEVVNDGRRTFADLRHILLDGPPPTTGDVTLRPVAHARTYFDGDAFTGLPLGTLGAYGLTSRTEELAFTDAFLDDLFPPPPPTDIPGDGPGGPAGGKPGGGPVDSDPLPLPDPAFEAAAAQTGAPAFSGTPTPPPAKPGPVRPPYLTPDAPVVWQPEYPEEFRTRLPALAGYRHYRDGEVPGSPAGFYRTTGRFQYDTQAPGRTPRGLVVAALDPLGARSGTDHDKHDLLAVRVTDAAGLPTTATHDYRVLKPASVTDPNGTTHTVTYSPAALVTARFARGAGGEGDGTAPGVRLIYDLDSFDADGTPLSVRTERRVHYDTDTATPAAQRDDVLVSVEYSDGFGRIVQTRGLAEDTVFGDAVFGGRVIPPEPGVPPGPTVGRTRGPGDPDNVVVTGARVYDNKGRVVQRYEPFFATGFGYAAPGTDQLGQRAQVFYDPRGQVVRTANPDGSEERMVQGVPVDLGDPDTFTPTPWEAYSYDANDNAGRTHPTTATDYRSHWNTPASTELDALGRAVATVVRNGPTSDQWFTTRTGYDILGNPVAITDPVGRTAFTYRFDLGGRRWRALGGDAGARDTVPDALGRTVEARDGRGALTLAAFDVLARPSRVWARDDIAAPVTLRERVDYGDAGAPDQPAADRAAARAAHVLGRVVRRYDGAGLTAVDAVDFKGNVLGTTRRMIADAPVLATYERARTAGWQVVPFVPEWTPAPGQSQAARDAELLEATGYISTTAYDALDRVTRHVLPADVDGRRRVVAPTYNRAGALEQVRLDDTVYVQRIAYDAKGQRALIAYGNGVLTRYAYDPRTFRTARMRTEHYTLAGDAAYRPTGAPLQDVGYEFDLAGNVLALHDRTPGSGIPNNAAAAAASDPVLRALLGSGDALDRRFAYDPTYRLVTATGREAAAAPAGDPWADTPRGADPTLTQPYTERYDYDAAGTLVRLSHSGSATFTRQFTVSAASSRQTRATIGTLAYDFAYDDNGNLTGEAASRRLAWTHDDRLKAFATQTAGAEPSLHAQYFYDHDGRRTKKLVRKQGGTYEVVHYVDGLFEHHRWTGIAAGANNHVHVMDEHRRIALVRTGPAHPDERGPAVAYHLPDHLGSANVVVDGGGSATNREEFTPYGETSFGGFTRKRYRFTGRERDEESGLALHGVRYYRPWTGTWTAPDPQGHPTGVNLYRYCADNPLKQVDTSGGDFHVVFDFDHNRITISAQYAANTLAEIPQLTAGLALWNNLQGTQYRGMDVQFQLRAIRAVYPIENARRITFGQYMTQLNRRDPMVNLYANYADEDARAAWVSTYAPKEVEADGTTGKFTGGQTRIGKVIAMNRERHDGDQGDSPVAVAHEAGHTLGLHDRDELPAPDPAFVPGGIMDKDFITSVRGSTSMRGYTGVKPTQREVTAILNAAVASQGTGTPHIRFSYVLDGVTSREFDTYDHMMAAYNAVTTQRLLKGLDAVAPPTRELPSTRQTPTPTPTPRP